MGKPYLPEVWTGAVELRPQRAVALRPQIEPVTHAARAPWYNGGRSHFLTLADRVAWGVFAVGLVIFLSSPALPVSAPLLWNLTGSILLIVSSVWLNLRDCGGQCLKRGGQC